MQYRQGDIFLKLVSAIPECEDKSISSMEGPEVKGSIILALGESTGHAHAIRNHNGNAVLMREKNSGNFLLVVVKEVDLTHEEHSKITLPIGSYQVIRQREYSPTEIRRVAD